MFNWEVAPSQALVIAHRGGGAEAVENSMQSFKQMQNNGFFYLETDAQLTADGQVILFHDSVLDRATTGSGKVSEHTWEQIQQVQNEVGEHPPLLAQVLQDFPQLVLNIDAKSDQVVEPLLAVISQYGAQDRVCLASFSERRLRRIARVNKGVSRSVGMGGMAVIVFAALFPLSLARRILYYAGFLGGEITALQVPEKYYGVPIATKRLLKVCHSLGWALQVWTVNDPAQMRKLLHLGVDALITDYPQVAKEQIEQYALNKV